MATTQPKQFAVCIDNTSYVASLETRKLYVVLPNVNAEKHDMLRVIDESGEDYLYPKTMFVPIELKPAVKKAVFAA